MELKRAKTNRRLFFVSLLIIAITASSFIVDFNGRTNVPAKKNSLNSKTQIADNRIDYEQLIANRINLIHEDSIFSIHIVEQLGINNLIFAYKNPLQGRQKSDIFFVHLFLKDSTKLISGKFINLDFPAPQPVQKMIGGTNHFFFTRPLVSTRFKGRFIDVDDIEHINTGRYSPGINRSQNILNLKPSGISPIELTTNTLPKVNIYVKDKSFRKIRSKREQAINDGVLTTEEDDMVKGKIALQGQSELKAEFRLKGDLTDHLRSENKWSYRFIMDGEATFKGLRKFSIQHPRARNYLWEWLFHRTIKNQNIIGLRYDFIDVNINVDYGVDSVQQIPMGIMALEESFDKILIENNGQREGLILAFDESLLWEDRKRQMSSGLDLSARSANLVNVSSAPIKVFNRNKVLSDPKLAKQFKIAKDLLDGLKTGKYKISEVFDVEKLASFTALSNLFGGQHGLIWHNLRIYYNPVTSKLEPISFDTDGGKKISKLQNYPMSSGDAEYERQLMKKLEMVANEEFINDMVGKHYAKLDSTLINLNSEFDIEFDLSVLEYNSNFIKKQLNPENVITAGLIDFDKDRMAIEIQNLTPYDIKMEGLVNKKGRMLSTNVNQALIKGDERKVVVFQLNKHFDNAFVSKKNKKGGFRFPNDVDKIKISYYLDGLGIDNLREGDLIPYGTSQDLDESVKKRKTMFEANYSQFSFVKKTGNEITFIQGEHSLNTTMVIPTGMKVVVEEGFSLDIKNGASLVSFSSIFAKGSKKTPIHFYSSDGSGKGIFITNTKRSSRLEHCRFSNLSNPVINQWELSGAVNFHEATVEISNSVFEGNNCEDALNIIRSDFLITESVFQNTYSDSFDGDFVKGEIIDSEFINSGNDGIDVSGSEITIKNVRIDNPSDKAISGGEGSVIKGGGIKISNGEIGIVSKDLSRVELSDIEISGTRLGLSSFQKKTEYGHGLIKISNLKLKNIEVDHLVENGSTLTIDGIPVQTVSNNVIDQMYGNEYGKSSR